MKEDDKTIEGIELEDAKLTAAQNRQFSRRFKLRLLDAALRVYSALGLIVAIFGASVFLLGEFELSERDRAAILVSAAGLMLTVVSLAAGYYYRQREMGAREKELRHSRALMSRLLYLEMIEEWSKFESLARDALHEDQRQNRRISISDILKTLRDQEVISSIESEALMYCLQVRNSIAHGKIDEIDTAEISFLLRRLRGIAGRLKPSSEH